MSGLQERSFKEFASRPENKPLLEQHQQQEVAAALQLQEEEQLAILQQQVSDTNRCPGYVCLHNLVKACLLEHLQVVGSRA
jgi:hypothetical protein